MSFLAVFDLSDAGWIVLGGAFGYAYVRYKERVRRQQLADAKREEIESAKREAEALLREARVVANEEAIKLRSQAELAYVTRQQEVAAAEQRLAQREQLINTQLEGFLQRERHIQSQQVALDAKECALEKARTETDALARDRREQLAKLANLSEADARAQFLKEAEQAALRDANEVSRRILAEAKTRSEEQAKRIVSLAIQRYAAQHTYETCSRTPISSASRSASPLAARASRKASSS